jgi:hypothetical protein
MPRNRSTLIQGLIKGLNAKGHTRTARGDRLPTVTLDVTLDTFSINADKPWQGWSDNPRTYPSGGVRMKVG